MPYQLGTRGSVPEGLCLFLKVFHRARLRRANVTASGFPRIRESPNPGANVAAVFIRCPTSGWPVATGIETEPGDFIRLPAVRSRLTCPSCGKEHGWTVKMAWLADQPAPQVTKPLRRQA